MAAGSSGSLNLSGFTDTAINPSPASVGISWSSDGVNTSFTHVANHLEVDSDATTLTFTFTFSEPIQERFVFDGGAFGATLNPTNQDAPAPNLMQGSLSTMSTTGPVDMSAASTSYLTAPLSSTATSAIYEPFIGAGFGLFYGLDNTDSDPTSNEFWITTQTWTVDLSKTEDSTFRFSLDGAIDVAPEPNAGLLAAIAASLLVMRRRR